MDLLTIPICLQFYVHMDTVSWNFLNLELKKIFFIIFRNSENNNLKRAVMNTFTKIKETYIIK